MADLVSFRAYARMRGVSHQAVSKMIATGRLSKSVQVVAGARMIDPVIANEELRANTSASATREKVRVATGAEGDLDSSLSDLPPTKSNLSLARVQTQRTGYQALLAKLEFEERSGVLCNVHEVRAEAFRIVRESRDHLLLLPERLADSLAVEADAGRVREMLRTEINGALTNLSELMKVPSRVE